MQEDKIIREIADELQKFQLQISSEIISVNQLKKALSDSINYLVTNDFSRLIAVLYCLDISEKKLKGLLQNSTNISAGDIIAEMIVERQKEKVRTRQLFSGNNNYCNEEKW